MRTESGVCSREIAEVDLDRVSSVYGPVDSWRVGKSLGIDLLVVNSICSFNCTYCQLGSIQVRRSRRGLFVPTEKLIKDLEASNWREASIATFSGSGEPTLASNLGEAIDQVKSITGKPVLVLTNGSLLGAPDLRSELSAADRVYVKLDAASEEVFQRVNRPVEGISLDSVVAGAVEFRRGYRGYLGVQTMFLHNNVAEAEGLAKLVNRIGPDEFQINSPTRPYPSEWILESRGGLKRSHSLGKTIKPIDADQAGAIVERLRRLVRGTKIVSVWDGPGSES